MGASEVRSFSIVSFDRLYGGDAAASQLYSCRGREGGSIAWCMGVREALHPPGALLFPPPNDEKRLPPRDAPGCSNLHWSAAGQHSPEASTGADGHGF